ncbi:E3 ubiquitin-protein ligase Os04g0590900-like [Miscanthus floridulus]|uniref:E3 ubiquitin-protein ligase Os04g0590900-like n=1 Tax=Miscanthus floridulus TaxID=154761 RepID=UPI00345B277B
MRPHRRALFIAEHSPGAGDCEEHWSSCHTPPPVPSSPDFGPGPSPSLPPSFGGIPSYPPVFPPAPAPGHNGRRDQGGGMQGYGPPPPGVGGAGDHDRRQFVKYVLIAAGVIAFVSLILLGVSVAVRRRQVRRRRQALLSPSINAGGAANVDGGGGHGHEWGGGGVVHHVWNIRTVGLDEASISSIAVNRYRAGAGLLGAADCSVCLGEFQDGELVRLLPKCAHAFHVPCIDTWLRAHVNCPICRSDVLDPAVTAASASGGGGSESVESSSSPPADPDANANAAADQDGAASDAAPDHEGEESDGRDTSPAQEDQQEQSSSAQPPPPPPELLCPLPRNVRRAASMDAVAVSTAADVAELDRLPEEAPEEEQIGGRRKRWPGPSRAKASGSDHRSNLSTDRLAPSGVPRSFFSRHCRARSSVLPL